MHIELPEKLYYSIGEVAELYFFFLRLDTFYIVHRELQCQVHQMYSYLQ